MTRCFYSPTSSTGQRWGLGPGEQRKRQVVNVYEIGGLGGKVYSLICSCDGITAREIARELGIDRKQVNQLLYRYPFIHDLCYRDDQYRWYGLIRQAFPHDGLREYSGWYGYVDEFLEQGEDEWLAELEQGCRRIGRNLNDARGLLHSFRDTRETMLRVFADLAYYDVDCAPWEISFELRIKRAKWVRIYADVLVIAPTCAFSLEFKMKDAIEQGEVDQAAKYIPYLETVLGEKVPVVPALALTRASDLFEHVPTTAGNGEVAVSSPDLLFNVFDEQLGFLDSRA